MKIVVLLRAVHRDPGSEELVAGLGPCERAALRTAIDLAGADEGSAVVALCAGPPPDEAVLQTALRAGARRAIRFFDAAVDQRDLLALSTALAAAVQQLGFDLVLAGHRSADWGTGAVGATVAHLLGVPHVSNVVALHREGSALALEQLREDELLSLSLDLPAVAAIWAAPSRAFDERAEVAPVETWTLADVKLGLNLELAQRTPHDLQLQPAPARPVVLHTSASALLLQLRNQGLLGS